MELRHPVAVARWIHQRYRFPGPPASFAVVLADYPIRVDLRDWPPGLSGICVLGEELSSIGVNRNDSRGRRHFTLWREFYLMPDEWVVDLKGTLWVAARRLAVSMQAPSVRLDELGIERLE